MNWQSGPTMAALLVCVAVHTPAFADQIMQDPVQISSFLHAIPAKESDLAARLSSIGVTVDSIMIHKLTRGDVAEDPLHLARGDTQISILTRGVPDIPECQMLGDPTFIKRGHKYIPQDRTGVWLFTGRCALPE